MSFIIYRTPTTSLTSTATTTLTTTFETGNFQCLPFGDDQYIQVDIQEECSVQLNALRTLTDLCIGPDTTNFSCTSVGVVTKGLWSSNCPTDVTLLNSVFNTLYGTPGRFSCSLEGLVKNDNFCDDDVGILNSIIFDVLRQRYSSCARPTIATTTAVAAPQLHTFLFSTYGDHP